MSIALALTALLLSAGCSKDSTAPQGASTAPQAASTGSQAASGLPDHDPALAHKLVSEGAVLLDVRTPEEFAGKHVEGAVNIPVDALKERLGEVDKLTGNDASKPIVVYCQAGGRAARAKTMLVQAGHSRVTNLGGVDDWDRK